MLYGSIKPKEISNLILETAKVEVIPSQIILKDELNKLGSFKTEVIFHSEVKSKHFNQNRQNTILITSPQNKNKSV